MRAIAILSLAACGTSTAYRSTRITPAGKQDYLFGAQAAGAGTIDASAQGGPEHAAPMPELAVGVRRGIAERVELQLNGTLLPTKWAQTASIELAGKVRLAEHGRWSLATGAGVGYRIAHAGGAVIEGVFTSVPLIGGIDLGRHQLVVSLDAGFQRFYASGARPVNVPYAGGSLGFVWQIGRNWALVPEVGLERSPTANFMTEDSKLFHAGFVAVWRR